jgi:hypothetical protein
MGYGSIIRSLHPHGDTPKLTGVGTPDKTTAKERSKNGRFLAAS